jgi:hypothetical protein
MNSRQSLALCVTAILVSVGGLASTATSLASSRHAPPADVAPVGVSVSSVTVESAVKLEGSPATARLRLSILGSGLDAVTAVRLPGAVPTPDARILTQDSSLLTADVTVPLDASATQVWIVTNGDPVRLPDVSVTAAAAAPPPAGVSETEITVATQASGSYPNVYSVVLTAQKALFDANPNRMSVEIVPAGPANVRIRPGNTTKQLVIDFVAPEKFEVKDVIVSVYDNSDLDARQLKAIGRTVKAFSKKDDPQQPAITSARLVSLRRHALPCDGQPWRKDDRETQRPYCGTGRIRIEGKGFGSNPANINVGIVGRNPEVRLLPESIRVDATRFDETSMEVDFEFVVAQGYSLPMRLEAVSVSVTKPVASTVRKGDVDVTIGQRQTYLASTAIGPKRDGKLEYGYTVLDGNTAHLIFGRGISNNFYVIALAVVNNSEKKVAVPLSAIEAEVEWAHGGVEDADYEFLEGPATLRPVSLATVTAFFTADMRSKGKRARFFNMLEGIRTLGQTLIPLFGPGYETAHTIFTSGLIPGAKIAIGDLSDQQLQSLAGLSWENVEEIPGNGGSKVKFVFIQRGRQVFTNPGQRKPNEQDRVEKQIKNLYGVELTGYEILDTEARGGTQNKSLTPTLGPNQ